MPRKLLRSVNGCHWIQSDFSRFLKTLHTYIKWVHMNEIIYIVCILFLFDLLLTVSSPNSVWVAMCITYVCVDTGKSCNTETLLVPYFKLMTWTSGKRNKLRLQECIQNAFQDIASGCISIMNCTLLLSCSYDYRVVETRTRMHLFPVYWKSVSLLIVWILSSFPL